MSVRLSSQFPISPLFPSTDANRTRAKARVRPSPTFQNNTVTMSSKFRGPSDHILVIYDFGQLREERVQRRINPKFIYFQ